MIRISCEVCSPAVELPQSEWVWLDILENYPSLISSGPFGGLFVDYQNCLLVSGIEQIDIRDIIDAMEALKAGYSAKAKKEK